MAEMGITPNEISELLTFSRKKTQYKKNGGTLSKVYNKFKAPSKAPSKGIKQKRLTSLSL